MRPRLAGGVLPVLATIGAVNTVRMPAANGKEGRRERMTMNERDASGSSSGPASGARPGGNARTRGDPPDRATPEPSRRSFAGLWRRLRPVGRFAARHKGLVAAAAVALVVAAAANLAAIATMQPVIDKGFNAVEPARMDIYFLRLFAIVTLLAVATAIRAYFVNLLGERVAADLRAAALDRVIGLHPSFFEENRPSEIASRLTADAGLIQQVLSASASIALRNVLLFVGAVAMMTIYNPKLMAMISLVVPAVIVPIVVYGRKVRRLSRSSQDRIADVASLISESLGAIRIVQAFTREDFERRRFRDAVEAAFAVARRRVRARAVLTGIVIFLISASITFVLWQGAHAVVAGTMTGGEMAAFVGFAVMAAGAVGAVIETYGDFQRAAGAAERIAELLATEPAIRPPARPRPLPARISGDIRFAQVTFCYPSKPERPALAGFDLHVRPRETVALVGPSGAGKSTVLQLLLRFFDPGEGRVTIDGLDLRALDPVALRRQIALVPQETVLFAASVRDNIRYGRPGASDDEVLEAARLAHALEFIEELPQGLDTHVGEHGVRLSGGQRQRLAIARALLKDAPVLLLDEATSSLDSRSEHLIQEALSRLMADRTTIVIAHRLATVREADRILVMNEGRIEAQGRHGELLERSSLYRTLARLQFADAADADRRRCRT